MSKSECCASAKLLGKTTWVDPDAYDHKQTLQSTNLPDALAKAISHHMTLPPASSIAKPQNQSPADAKSVAPAPVALPVAPPLRSRAAVAGHDFVVDFQCSDWLPGAAKAAKLPSAGHPGLCFVVSLDDDEAQVCLLLFGWSWLFGCWSVPDLPDGVMWSGLCSESLSSWMSWPATSNSRSMYRKLHSTPWTQALHW